MTDSPYRSSDFLKSGDTTIEYEDLDYTNKLKIKALEGLDSLAASLNAISNIQAIEFQISHLNTITTGFTDQMAAKDAEIEALTTQLANIENTQAASRALLEAEIASLKAANESLTENFNKFKSVLTSIDSLTDEVID
jgi:predicted  nucleic acid-binding Zn-ribbon protein